MYGVLRFFASLLLLFAICRNHSINGEDKPYKVVCYWSSWSAYRNGDGKFDVDNINPLMCTHIIYAFAELSRDNKISPYDPNLDLEDNNGMGMYKRFIGLRAKNKDLKLLLSIGGWKEGSLKYSVMARDKNSRSTFIQSCISLLKKHGFNGLDLSWLYPANRGGVADDKKNMVLLLQEMKAAFSRNGLIVSAAISGSVKIIDTAYDVPEINKYLDFINVMTYDYHGDWDSKTGHGTPLYSRPNEDMEEKALNVDSTIKYLISKGASRNKLVVGLAFYGRTFNLKFENVHSIGAPSSGKGTPGVITQEAGILGYIEICDHLSKDTGWKVELERHQQVPFTYKEKQWIAYDDSQSISFKMDYIKEQKLGGAMVWSIDTDDFRGECYGFPYPLLSVVTEDLNGPIERITGKEEDIVTTTTLPIKISTQNPVIGTTTKKDDNDVTCLKEGFFRHPTDCTRFCFCITTPYGFSKVWYKCGPGTVFNEAIAVCGHPHTVPGCK